MGALHLVNAGAWLVNAALWFLYTGVAAGGWAALFMVGVSFLMYRYER